jgi:hypothetical protein
MSGAPLDGVEQVTTFAYDDPNLLTKVADPFGRYATIGLFP